MTEKLPGLKDLSSESVDWRHKGFPQEHEVTLANVGQQGWSIFDSGFVLPIMVLKNGALRHNIGTMARFCEHHGVSFAPHGKTTMAPQIIQRQLDAGAWGITSANVGQARVFRGFGVERIFLANELVDTAALHWVAEELSSDEAFEFYCLVDSERGVMIMDEALSGARTSRRLPVLVELGAKGTRAGARSTDEALSVAHAVASSRHLELAGVEGFEGVINREDPHSRVEAVRQFVGWMAEVANALDQDSAFSGRQEILLSAGGSVFFDKVADLVRVGPLSRPTRVVLRSGCYVTHDDGAIDRGSPMGSHSTSDERFEPAIEVWGDVLSRPEPGLAIVGVGKRDAPFDSDLPIPKYLRRRSGELHEFYDATVSALNDQHAYVRFEGVEPEIGDLVGFGISHPCTAFDKWRLIPEVDEDYRVVDAIMTFF